ncbi:hypothetical protein RSOL_396640 [Rhizoctonia solani AG-3 Rhs1AP]|uniref:Uncharacterized protein n=1 Tax=Rhizoctonia solani AG-3 Rhs1AP TaxID=1086054 RepID=X8JE08_9AGAM|nr:hypothetical protein RSOL_396640 [Rhizoctonia solani AG-3 Rhs1AP]
MSQHPQPPYPDIPLGFIHPDSSGNPFLGSPPNPPQGVPLGPLVPLEIVQQALTPLYAIARETSESVKVAVEGVKQLNRRLEAVEAGIKYLSVDADEDGDDEGGPTEQKDGAQRPKKRARTFGGVSKRINKSVNPKPEGTVLHIMKDIVRDEILYQGCDAKKWTNSNQVCRMRTTTN